MMYIYSIYDNSSGVSSEEELNGFSPANVLLAGILVNSVPL
jgi:hypothetical protein